MTLPKQLTEVSIRDATGEMSIARVTHGEAAGDVVRMLGITIDTSKPAHQQPPTLVTQYRANGETFHGRKVFVYDSQWSDER